MKEMNKNDLRNTEGGLTTTSKILWPIDIIIVKPLPIEYPITLPVEPIEYLM